LLQDSVKSGPRYPKIANAASAAAVADSAEALQAGVHRKAEVLAWEKPNQIAAGLGDHHSLAMKAAGAVHLWRSDDTNGVGLQDIKDVNQSASDHVFSDRRPDFPHARAIACTFDLSRASICEHRQVVEMPIAISQGNEAGEGHSRVRPVPSTQYAADNALVHSPPVLPKNTDKPRPAWGCPPAIVAVEITGLGEPPYN
jgi:hypothetical protein